MSKNIEIFYNIQIVWPVLELSSFRSGSVRQKVRTQPKILSAFTTYCSSAFLDFLAMLRRITLKWSFWHKWRYTVVGLLAHSCKLPLSFFHLLINDITYLSPGLCCVVRTASIIHGVQIMGIINQLSFYCHQLRCREMKSKASTAGPCPCKCSCLHVEVRISHTHAHAPSLVGLFLPELILDKRPKIDGVLSFLCWDSLNWDCLELSSKPRLWGWYTWQTVLLRPVIYSFCNKGTLEKLVLFLTVIYNQKQFQTWKCYL